MKKYRPEEVISGLEYMLEEAKYAKSTLEYSSDHDRLRKKVWKLEQRIIRMEEIFEEHNIEL